MKSRNSCTRSSQVFLDDLQLVVSVHNIDVRLHDVMRVHGLGIGLLSLRLGTDYSFELNPLPHGSLRL